MHRLRILIRILILKRINKLARQIPQLGRSQDSDEDMCNPTGNGAPALPGRFAQAAQPLRGTNRRNEFYLNCSRVDVPTTLLVRDERQAWHEYHLRAGIQLLLLACRGACGLAPVLAINDEVYGQVSPERGRPALHRMPIAGAG